MSKLIIDGYITNEWARRLINHGATLKVVGSLSGIPKSCQIRFENNEEFTQPIKIQVLYKGEEPYNPGIK